VSRRIRYFQLPDGGYVQDFPIRLCYTLAAEHWSVLVRMLLLASWCLPRESIYHRESSIQKTLFAFVSFPFRSDFLPVEVRYPARLNCA
jgi:hypothetical protein